MDPSGEPSCLACPGCGEALDIPPETAGQLTRCPYCNSEFFASADIAGLDVVDDTTEPGETSEPKTELDNNRIRQLTALRRGTLRARSWCWIGMTVALSVAVELIGKAVMNAVHAHGLTARATGFVLFAGLAVALAVKAFETGRRLTAEITASRCNDPAEEPDFSTLSDGSQRWTNLHDIR